MKKLILMVEDDFIEVLQDFKKHVNKWHEKSWPLSDEKAMILITRYFMEQFKQKDKTQTRLF